MNILRKWLIAATTAELNDLLARTGVSKGHYYKLSTGERSASADTAGVIEQAGNEIREARRKDGLTNLPELRRGDICNACGKCPYYSAISNATTESTEQ